MKKHMQILLSLLSTIVLTATPLTVFAAEKANDYFVRFTEAGVMEEELPDGVYVIYDDLQPGDTKTFEVTIRNDYADTTNWYLDNEIVRSLEDYANNRNTNGGAYTYILTYIGNDGVSRSLFSNDTVGGEIISDDGATGLHQAAEGLEAEDLKDFTYLGQLPTGGKGKVTLTISLDGETQGNDYQYTMAQSKIRFAVALPEVREERVEHRRTIVKTGDEFNMLPYFAVAFFSGSLLLLLCIFRVIDSKKEKKGEA